MSVLHSNLTVKKVFKFWLPLAATWLMMSVEGPFLAAVIARLAEPKFNLAAYGVAFSFALIIEAPIIMIMSASTALVKNADSFIRLRNYTYMLNGIITVSMLIVLIPPVFFGLTETLIGLPANVSELTYIATIILIPWPGAIGYRRFYQGILIRNNLTKRVAYGTIIRLGSMICTALLLYHFSDFPGVAVGAAALSVGVITEAVASRLMTNNVIKHIRQIPNNEKPLTNREITFFYYPLALTSMLTLGVHPLVTFFVGQSKLPLESLAVLPVVNALVFIFKGLGLSFQEAAISLFGDKNEGYVKLKNFAWLLGLFNVTCLGIIAFSPLADMWLRVVSGLSPLLTEISQIPLKILVFLPGLTVLLSFQRAALVVNRNTSPITMATVIEVMGIILMLFIAVSLFEMIGAYAAALAFLVGSIGASLYLMKPFNKSVRQNI